MREAPSLVLIQKLLEVGCKIRAFDPAAMQESKRRLGDLIYYANDPYDALVDADALLLVTEWKQFRLPSWSAVKKLMKQPVIFDGRNIYDPEELKNSDIEYHCIGKS
jgi:UDPglucose 6-dehydrogenase